MTVIADASPIIALIGINRLYLLEALFKEVLITDIVREEIQHELPTWILVTDNYDENDFVNLSVNLDKGEASAIALAAGMMEPRLIMDEIKGRKQAAELTIPVIGTVGLILLAKSQGIIASGKDVLNKLVADGFWISQHLYNRILAELGETS